MEFENQNLMPMDEVDAALANPPFFTSLDKWTPYPQRLVANDVNKFKGENVMPFLEAYQKQVLYYKKQNLDDPQTVLESKRGSKVLLFLKV